MNSHVYNPSVAVSSASDKLDQCKMCTLLEVQEPDPHLKTIREGTCVSANAMTLRSRVLPYVGLYGQTSAPSMQNNADNALDNAADRSTHMIRWLTVMI